MYHDDLRDEVSGAKVQGARKLCAHRMQHVFGTLIQHEMPMAERVARMLQGRRVSTSTKFASLPQRGGPHFIAHCMASCACKDCGPIPELTHCRALHTAGHCTLQCTEAHGSTRERNNDETPHSG